jgi:hypothetical protein
MNRLPHGHAGQDGEKDQAEGGVTVGRQQKHRCLRAALARTPSCAQQAEDGEQGRTINQLMAGLVATHVERLLDGTCCWMASYLDLSDGLLRCAPAERQAVSHAPVFPIVSLMERHARAAVAS